MKICIIFNKFINFTKTMENCKVELAAGKETVAEVKIKRDILPGDSLSPLLLVIEMMSLIYIFKKCIGATNSQNHKTRLTTLCTWII